MADDFVLSESAAIEVLAYLVTAARTQLDEAAEYAPMRLMTAARRLAESMSERSSAPVRDLASAIGSLPIIATPSADLEGYTARLDEICVKLADCLLALDHPTPGQPER